MTTPAGWPGIIVEAGFIPSAPGIPPGTLILDDATSGQLDTGTLGPDIAAWTSIGGYMPDGTAIIQAVTITRASTRQLGPLVTYQAGTCTLTLANNDARFSPENLAGPYVSGGVTQVRPMIPVRVSASWNGITYPLFSGYVRSWTPPTAQNGPDYDYVVAEATDPFCVMEGVTIPQASPVGAGELSGARVGRILGAAGWYAAPQGQSVIGTGQSALQGTAFGDSALALLQLTADSEIGDLYADGAGRVVFRDRHAPLTETRSTTVQAVFGDLPGTSHPAGTELPYADIARPDDDTTMANDIQATIDGSSSVQRVTDTASVARFLFPRSYVRSDLLLQTDADALNWAQWVAYIAKNDEARFDSMTLQPAAHPDDLWPQVLGREIGDRIQVWRRPPGMTAISKDCFIRGITHTVTVDGLWETEWTLQDASKYGSFLVLDDPVLGQLGSNALTFLREPVPWPDGEPPWTDAEIKGARIRQEHQRTRLPRAGERVLFRRKEWDDPVPAIVTSVQDMTTPLCANGTAEHPPDLHVWEHPDQQTYPPQTWTHPRIRAELRLQPDPWPRVQLELEGGSAATCRESRVRGAPGWLRPGEGR